MTTDNLNTESDVEIDALQDEVTRLRARLATVERERDEAREELTGETEAAEVWQMRAEAAEAESARLRWQIEHNGCAAARMGETTYECGVERPCGLCRLRGERDEARDSLADQVKARMSAEREREAATKRAEEAEARERFANDRLEGVFRDQSRKTNEVLKERARAEAAEARVRELETIRANLHASCEGTEETARRFQMKCDALGAALGRVKFIAMELDAALAEPAPAPRAESLPPPSTVEDDVPIPPAGRPRTPRPGL